MHCAFNSYEGGERAVQQSRRRLAEGADWERCHFLATSVSRRPRRVSYLVGLAVKISGNEPHDVITVDMGSNPCPYDHADLADCSFSRKEGCVPVERHIFVHCRPPVDWNAKASLFGHAVNLQSLGPWMILDKNVEGCRPPSVGLRSFHLSPHPADPTVGDADLVRGWVIDCPARHT